eukprot:2519849-Rhodomonas_salina.1
MDDVVEGLSRRARRKTAGQCGAAAALPSHNTFPGAAPLPASARDLRLELHESPLETRNSRLETRGLEFSSLKSTPNTRHSTLDAQHPALNTQRSFLSPQPSAPQPNTLLISSPARKNIFEKSSTHEAPDASVQWLTPRDAVRVVESRSDTAAWQTAAVARYLEVSKDTLPSEDKWNRAGRAIPDVSAVGVNYKVLFARPHVARACVFRVLFCMFCVRAVRSSLSH